MPYTSIFFRKAVETPKFSEVSYAAVGQICVLELFSDKSGNLRNLLRSEEEWEA